MKPESFPILNDNEAAVLQVDGITGIVLSKTGEWNISENSPFLVFPDLVEANDFVHRDIQYHPLREYTIFDSKGEVFSIYKNEEALINEVHQRKRRPWWKIWK